MTPHFFSWRPPSEYIFTSPLWLYAQYSSDSSTIETLRALGRGVILCEEITGLVIFGQKLEGLPLMFITVVGSCSAIGVVGSWELGGVFGCVF